MNNVIRHGLTLSMMAVLYTACSNEAPRNYTGSGTVEATEYMVSAVAAGRILDMRVDEGTAVTAGDTIAVIDTETLRLQRDVTAKGLNELDWNEKVIDRETDTAAEQVKQAVARLENAEKSLARIRALNRSNAATADALDRAQTEVDVARSRVEQARKQVETMRTKRRSLTASRDKIHATLRLMDSKIADGIVTAPHVGTVLETFMETGEVTAAGRPICSLGGLDEMWLNIYVGEADLGNLSIGQTAEISIDSHPEQTFGGTVTWISDSAEFTPKNVQTRDSRLDLVYAVKISIDNQDGIFKIGMPADAYIEGL